MAKSNSAATRCVLLALSALFLSNAAVRADWRGFYEQETLRYWAEQMPPGIEENLREVIWPKLTPEERKALAGVRLAFPLEDASHPMNFYARPDDKPVLMPISSLRFFGDLALANAWLNRNDYTLDTITDYLGMLKYQWPGKLKGKPHRPLDALKIPATAREEAGVHNIFQRAFGTGVVYVLAHELGHLFHRHGAYADISLEAARHNEEQADEFALEIMRRIGDAPLGMPLFFSILAQLEPYTGDTGYAEPIERTHPVTAGRIRAIADALEANTADYARTSTDIAITRLKLKDIALRLRTIALVLADTGAQDLMRQKGLTATESTLGPRRIGERISAASAPRSTGGHEPFDGAYVGEWFNTKGTSFEGDLILKRRAANVTGTFSFGAGNVTFDGVVDGEQLHFNWKWGKDYFGKGVLQAAENGNVLSGIWGYTKAESGAGTWKLRRSSR